MSFEEEYLANFVPPRQVRYRKINSAQIKKLESDYMAKIESLAPNADLGTIIRTAGVSAAESFSAQCRKDGLFIKIMAKSNPGYMSEEIDVPLRWQFIASKIVVDGTIVIKDRFGYVQTPYEIRRRAHSSS